MQIEKQFSEIIIIIQQARNKALKSVNTVLIDLYWEVGKYVNAKIRSSEWGKSIVENLSEYIKVTEPEIKGFSHQNIWRMKQFYEYYENFPKLSPLVREITWTNNMLILSKTKSEKEAEFYLQLTKQEHYSKRELERQIDTGIYERTISENKKMSLVAKETFPSVEKSFRDIYMLDFLGLPTSFSEKDLRKSIVRNLKNFILEFGKDFSFIGQEYIVQVGKKDFYIDLLFYHRELQCLVAFDLKITDFKPEYLGKMEFYLEALDSNIKKHNENPSIGIVLCKSKDTEVVEFALRRTISPAIVAQYETKLISRKILANKLGELFQLAKINTNNKGLT